MKKVKKPKPSELRDIEIGDIVHVNFADGVLMGARVKYMPCQPGDYWHFVTKAGELVIVQSFEYIVRPK